MSAAINQDTDISNVPEDMRRAIADVIQTSMMIRIMADIGGDTTQYELRYQQQVAKCRKLAQRYKPKCSLLGDVLNVYC